jgi:hypothetical protein
VRPLPGLDLPPLRADLYGKLRVSVDGDEVERCIAFDADAGFVVAYATEPDGRIQTEHGVALRATLVGRVAVGWVADGA